jgi:cellulose synthase/poly-beta-1,6-N-acetylglucosamine synthase-like glycosyltransferase
MRISVIVPCRTESPYLVETLSALDRLDYDDYEVIVVSDKELDFVFPNTHILVSGKLLPSKKRNLGTQIASGEVIAFIDDDAFPEKSWLMVACQILNQTSAAAVCGPAASVPNSKPRETATSSVLESSLVSGPFRYRYVPTEQQEVDDYPTSNLLIRKSIFDMAGGFDPNLYPGEDTKLCLDITQKLHQKIVYHPSILVYHHRRPLYIPYLKQIGLYARTRGRFVRIYPETSLKFAYFRPSIIVTGFLFAAIASIFGPSFRILFGLLTTIYIASLLVASRQHKYRVSFWVFASGVLSSHLWYGLNFIRGIVFQR